MDVSVDKSDMHSALQSFHTQVRAGWKLGEDLQFDNINRIVIAGMGGSALAGEILKSYLFHIFKIPIEVVKSYTLPEYVDTKTLLISSSYSGNTEEAIEAFRNGNRKGCQIVVMAHGGKLIELAKKLNKPVIRIPMAIQPRMAYGYGFFAILRILQNSGLIKNHEDDIQKLSEVLKKDVYKKKGAELSEKLVGQIPIIYSSERLYAIAYKWKINFNENTKIHAFCNYFSELNHNEMEGYENPNGNYYVLVIKDDYDERKIKKRMEVMKKILQLRKIPILDIELSGTSDLIKIFSTIYLGDWTAYYLALRNDTDPTPVDLIEDFKKKL